MLSAAEAAGEAAITKMTQALDTRASFVFEAGAGAGKTHSLIKGLEHLIRSSRAQCWPKHQRVACVTYTNAAKDEIKRRVDRHPRVYCETLHALCWSAIQPFQAELRRDVSNSTQWKERLGEGAEIAQQNVIYDFGYRRITDDTISLHHDDVISFTAKHISSPRFRTLLADRFPYLLIDEYQDSDEILMEALLSNLDRADLPVLGLFGDHWQQIYDKTCGSVTSERLIRIDKGANFRASADGVALLNRMRPELPQIPNRAGSQSEVFVLHTNAWDVVRQTGSPHKGDLSPEDGQSALRATRQLLGEQQWDLAGEQTKILMLTHRRLAAEQGYSKLLASFRYVDSLRDHKHPSIKFLLHVLEPVLEAFFARRYGQMFSLLPGPRSALSGIQDKQAWTAAVGLIGTARTHGTVGEVLEAVVATAVIPIPDDVRELEALRTSPRERPEPKSTTEVDHEKLSEVAYQELVRFRDAQHETSAFATKHSVKGAEFPNVIVLVGRGWSKYDFSRMLEMVPCVHTLDEKSLAFFVRNRNLFYVATSRARQNLCVIFTQELSSGALSTLCHWFGDDAVRALPQP